MARGSATPGGSEAAGTPSDAHAAGRAVPLATAGEADVEECSEAPGCGVEAKHGMVVCVSPPAADVEHLLACDQCRADVEQLRDVVSAVRVDVTAGPAVAPPDRVWQGIAAETGVLRARSDLAS